MRTWQRRFGRHGRISARRDQLLATLRRYLDDERVLAAMEAVPREAFVPPELAEDAWDNVPLPIGCGQTISQPLVVARMCELLELTDRDRVLDVGTGSGYHAAVLARLCGHVWSVERHPELSAQAALNLTAAGVENVTLVVGDGTLGVPGEAPFDAINVAAACAAVPPALEAQLGPQGRLVAPVENGDQRLLLARRRDGELERTLLERVRFVPLI
jgi:protein-L-isoaspartate(D-aspartate) O-methyltransferase